MNLPYHENVTTIYFRKQIKWTNNLHQWDQKGRPQSTCGSLCSQPPDRGHIRSEPSRPSTWHHYIYSCAETTNNRFTQLKHLFDQRVISTIAEWHEGESEIYFHQFILDMPSFQFGNTTHSSSLAPRYYHMFQSLNKKAFLSIETRFWGHGSHKGITPGKGQTALPRRHQ
jgi:hypothetical protein